MCEFCIQHGSGKKWYFAAQNYASELAYSEGRDSFIIDTYKNYKKYFRRNVILGDIALKIPFFKKYALEKIEGFFSQTHSGQVISLEDAVTICSIPGRVSIVDCPCRKYILGKNEKKCILLGATAEIMDNVPEFPHVHDLGAEDAAELLKDFDNSGMVHTIWTYKTPYIGSICNCNNRECVLFHLKNHYPHVNVLKKGHEIGFVNEEACNGCRNCQDICQFNAVVLQGGKSRINEKCYGCGTCRNFCPEGAIQLIPKIGRELI
ncbi:MAG TPA: 4Fe-4S binding protein [Methanobacterium sp.]|nr:4Fe-4S binding protein [Methanobacterium sp.]